MMEFPLLILCVVEECTETTELIRSRVAGINGTTIAFD